jgi:FkbM family methyltransferase
MSSSAGSRHRRRSLPEVLGDLLPSGGPIGRVRRTLRPLVDRLLEHKRGGLRAVLPGGEVVLVAPAQRHMTWNDEEYSAFRATAHPGQVILEAGANVGCYTLLFAQWVGPSGRVFAFEPDPVAFEGLRRHVTMNSVDDRVTVLPEAVTDGSAARVRLLLGESSGVSRVAARDPGMGSRGVDVAATSIDRFCAERAITPDVIKIDVEGAELSVLRGARRTLAAAGPRLQLFVEMHPSLWPEFGSSADDLRRECERQRLEPERLDGSRADVWSIEGVCLRLRPQAP